MSSWRWILVMVLVMFSAFSSSSRADAQSKHQNDYNSITDQWGKPDIDGPPSWPGVQMAGWYGHNLTPGQKMRIHRRHKQKVKKYQVKQEVKQEKKETKDPEAPVPAPKPQ